MIRANAVLMIASNGGMTGFYLAKLTWAEKQKYLKQLTEINPPELGKFAKCPFLFR